MVALLAIGTLWAVSGFGNSMRDTYGTAADELGNSGASNAASATQSVGATDQQRDLSNFGGEYFDFQDNIHEAPQNRPLRRWVNR